jgi:hypothetical protein
MMLKRSLTEIRRRIKTEFQFVDKDPDNIIKHLALIMCGKVEETPYTQEQVPEFEEYCRLRAQVDNEFKRNVMLLGKAYDSVLKHKDTVESESNNQLVVDE